MEQLLIDLSGRGGLAPRHWGDVDRTVAVPNLRYLAGESQLADGVYNPMRRYGYLSPANGSFNSVTPTGGTFDAMLSSSIYDSVNDDFYFAERGEQIFRGTDLDDLVLQSEIDLGSTGTPRIMDLEIYQVNNVRKLFFVHEKSGNLQIGISDLPYDTSDDDLTWLTATATGAFTNALSGEAFMRVADNGFAYLFADNDVHKIDGTASGGTNGTVSANVLQFPEFFAITDAVDYRGNMYIAIRQDTSFSYENGETQRANNAQVGVYIWDRLTSVVQTRDYIPVHGCREIRKLYISPSGELRMICVNAERVSEIRRFTGSAFEVIEELGINAHPQFHDSLTVAGNMAMWLAPNGYVYGHGKIAPNEPEGLFKLTQLSDTLISSGVVTGAILFGGANTDSGSAGFKTHKTGLYLAYRTATPAYVMQEWDIYGTGSAGYTCNQHQGDVYSPVKYLPQMSTVHHIDVFMFPGGGSGSTTAGTVKIYFNQSTTQWASKTITRAESALGYKRFEVNKQYVNAVQLEIEFPGGTSVGTTDFAPSYAIIYYEPTNTVG